jgi:AraC-like DNA-binding protein
VEGAIHPVKPGAVFYLAKGCEHSFVEGIGRRPLCLALDFDFRGDSMPAHGLLAQGELRIVRQSISMLHVWQGGPAEVQPREAGAVLAILDVLMRAVGLIRQERGRVTLAVVRRVQGMFQEESEDRAPVARAAERVGYHPDHLSRLLKRETGMSAAQLRATEMLKRAKRHLALTKPIAAVAQDCGFSDPNYFSRWFRRQCGVTPRAWREGRGKDHS